RTAVVRITAAREHFGARGRIDRDAREDRRQEIVRDALPAAATIGRAPDAADGGDEDAVAIVAIDGDAGDAAVDVRRTGGHPRAAARIHRARRAAPRPSPARPASRPLRSAILGEHVRHPLLLAQPHQLLVGLDPLARVDLLLRIGAREYVVVAEVLEE